MGRCGGATQAGHPSPSMELRLVSYARWHQVGKGSQGTPAALHELCSDVTFGATFCRLPSNPFAAARDARMNEDRGLFRTPLVLVVDSQEWTARSLESILGSSGCAVLKAYTGRQALELSTKVRPDAIIVDLHLPDMTGPDLCRAMRNLPSVGRGTPILVLSTAPLGRSERLEAVQAGAWDILRPPLDPEELVLKVTTFVAAKLEADQAREESLCDPHTGLYNIRGILRRVDEVAADAARNRRSMTCVVVGVQDHEHSENRSSVVDPADLARSVARVLSSSTRLSDTVGRLGVSDYVIVSAGADEAGAHRLAQRVTEALRTGLDLHADVPVRVGVHHIDDAGSEPLVPVDFLSRATMDLRRAQSNPSPVT